MGRLLTASIVTLGLLVGMIASLILAILMTMDAISLPFTIAATIVISVLIWLLSPWLLDLSLSWINGMKFLSDQELETRHPHVHRMLHEVAREFAFTPARVGIIADRNPTAFTYGRGRGNARIVLTEGIFEFLDEDETRAVVAHELGHIVHRDFIVMTIAGCLVQILYQIYVHTTKRNRGSSDKKNSLAGVGFAALVFYWIGQYLLLYLSRTREYMADAFAASRTSPGHLASALVKVAYGIAKVEDSDSTAQLLRSTRHMGLIDVKNAHSVGLMASTGEGPDGPDGPCDRYGKPVHKPTPIPAEAMLFDGYNPWAWFAELNSTHPLTGKRILALGEMAKAAGKPFQMDIAGAARRAGVDKGELWPHFLKEAAIYFAPYLVALLTVLAGYWYLALATGAATVIATLFLRYPMGEPKPTTVMALMSDPRASPVIGRPVRLEGTAIGRADAGSFVGEDLVMRDASGFTTLDFRSMFGVIGDLLSGWLRVKNHIGETGRATGWFRRGMLGHVILSRLETKAGVLSAVPYFWQVLLSLAAIAGTAVFVLAGGAELAREVPWDVLAKP